jgi:hypothetical protein
MPKTTSTTDEIDKLVLKLNKKIKKNGIDNCDDDDKKIVSFIEDNIDEIVQIFMYFNFNEFIKIREITEI